MQECSVDVLTEYIEETCIKSPELWKYFPGGPHSSLEAYKYWFNSTFIPTQGDAGIIFAIFLKAGSVTRYNESGVPKTFQVADGTFAGTTGLLYASVNQSQAEVGHVMTLPQFHRTFVTTHATCLLLKHLLDPVPAGDLQIRRIQWSAHTENQPSIRAAQRCGFTIEGIRRWDRVLADNKQDITEITGRSEGRPVLDFDGNKIGPGRHTTVLSLCWDDWLDGKRDLIISLLAQT